MHIILFLRSGHYNHNNITSFIDYAIQIYVGQKATENQWRVMVLEFLHTALLYQATNTRSINVLDVLKQYLVLVKKEQWRDFSIQSDSVVSA